MCMKDVDNCEFNIVGLIDGRTHRNYWIQHASWWLAFIFVVEVSCSNFSRRASDLLSVTC